MKKFISVSPFIMLVIPVLLFLGLSLAVDKKQNSKETISTTTTTSINTNILVKAGKASLIQYLLK